MKKFQLVPLLEKFSNFVILSSDGVKFCIFRTFTVIIMTIFIRSSDSKYLQIRNIGAQNILWVQFFQFFCCSIFIFFEEICFLLHKKFNFLVFLTFYWRNVIMCRLRFYLPNEVKSGSFNFQYFWSWISLAIKR